MNPILYVLYHFFKNLVRVAVRVFYSKTTLVNGDKGNCENACIVVSNHPATVLDPLNTAIHIRKTVFFLANASLFKNEIAAWLLSRLYCIPIERIQDTDGRPLNNEASFEKATQHLTNGGCLYVAPEGTSYVWRRLRKIKTGTARIALAAENRNDWQLGLTILPAGLNYSDPTKFRSHLLTIFGEPIRVADFRADWEKDKVEAVQKLTAKISESLSALLLDTTDDEEDALLDGLEMVAQNEQPLPSEAHFRRSQEILTRLKEWRAGQPANLASLSERTGTYVNNIKSLKISDKAFISSSLATMAALKMAALFPLALLGFANHFLPCFIIGQLACRLNKDIHWEPTYKFLIGLVFYPLIIALQTWLVHHFLGNNWLTLSYLLMLAPSGLAAEAFCKQGTVFLEKLRFNRLKKAKPAVAQSIEADRNALLEKIAFLND